MWYKNIAGRIFALVTKHACNSRIDGLWSPRADMVLRFINPSGRFNNLSGQFINPSAQIIKLSGRINKLSGQIILNRSDDLLIRPDRLVVAGCLLTGYLC